MQITVSLGLDRLPEEVKRQLERAGVKVHDEARVVVTRTDTNGDEITTIYCKTFSNTPESQQKPLLDSKENLRTSAPLNLPKLLPQSAQPEKLNISREHHLIRNERIWIKTENDAIDLEQAQINKLDYKNPAYTRRKEALGRRRFEMQRRASAQGERRRVLREATQSDIPPLKAEKKRINRRSRSKTPVQSSAVPARGIKQQPLPTLPEYIERPQHVFNPSTIPGAARSAIFPCQPRTQAPNYFTFSSPPRFTQAQTYAQQHTSPHPGRLGHVGQSSRDLQDTTTFPPTPSFVEALGPKRTGSNKEPLAKRRKSPSKFQTAPSVLNGFASSPFGRLSRPMFDDNIKQEPPDKVSLKIGTAKVERAIESEPSSLSLRNETFSKVFNENDSAAILERTPPANRIMPEPDIPKPEASALLQKPATATPAITESFVSDPPIMESLAMESPKLEPPDMEPSHIGNRATKPHVIGPCAKEPQIIEPLVIESPVVEPVVMELGVLDVVDLPSHISNAESSPLSSLTILEKERLETPFIKQFAESRIIQADNPCTYTNDPMSNSPKASCSGSKNIPLTEDPAMQDLFEVRQLLQKDFLTPAEYTATNASKNPTESY